MHTRARVQPAELALIVHFRPIYSGGWASPCQNAWTKVHALDAWTKVHAGTLKRAPLGRPERPPQATGLPHYYGVWR